MSAANCKTTGIGPSCEPSEVGDGHKYECLEKEIRRCKGELNRCIGEARAYPYTTFSFGSIFSGWIIEGASMVAARVASIASCYSTLNCSFRPCYCLDWSCGGFCLPDPGGVGPRRPVDPEEPDDDEDADDPDDGPKLTSLSVTSSTYDRVIERVYGTHIVFGNIFWASEPRREGRYDVVIDRTTGQYVSQVVTHWYINFALGLCAGEIQDVVRIWADDVLIYTRDFSNDAALVNGVRLDGAKLNLDPTRPYNTTYGRIYIHTGADNQPVSKVMSAGHTESTPAYRGLAYIVFENYDITQTGARLPEFRVEVVRNVSTAEPTLEMEVAHNTATTLGALPTDFLYVSPLTNTIITGGEGSSASGARPGLRVLNYDTLEEQRNVVPGVNLNTPETYDLHTFAPLNDKYFAIQTLPDLNQRKTVYGRNAAPAQINAFGTAAGIDNHGTTVIANLARSPYASIIIPMRTAATVSTYALFAASGRDLGVYSIDAASGAFAPLKLFNDLTTGDISKLVAYRETSLLETTVPRVVDYVAAFAMVSGGSAIDVRRVTTFQSDGATYFSTTQTPTIFSIPRSAWGGVVSGASLRSVERISHLDAFLLTIVTSAGAHMLLWKSATGVVWSTAIPSPPIAASPGPRLYDYPSDDYHWIGSDNNVYSIQYEGGQVEPVTAPVVTCVGAQYYNALEGAITYLSGQYTVTKLFLTHKRVAPQNLADVIRDILESAGLLPEEINVDGLEGVAIDGYKANTSGSVTSLLKQLSVLFGLYFYEQGGIIGVTVRAQGAPTTVDENVYGDETVTLKFTDRYTELLSVSLSYNSRTNDYKDQTQSLRKTQFVRGTEFVENIVNEAHAWPIVMTDTAARIVCERILFEDELIPREAEVNLGPGYSYLSPGDLVILILGDREVTCEVINIVEDIVGLARKLKLREIRPELFIENASLQGVTDFSGRYTGDPIPRPKIDTPLVFSVPPPEYQTLAEFGSASSVMMMGTDDGIADFANKDFYYVAQSGLLVEAGRQTKRTLIGTLITPPLKTQAKYSTDTTSEMVIRFSHTSVADYLTNATKSELLSDFTKNILFVGEEIIQYGNYVLSGDGHTVTFTNLHRGLRSTDDRIDNHLSGELCALYVEGSMVKVVVNLRGESDSIIDFGIVPAGRTPDTGAFQPQPLFYYNRLAPMIPKVLRAGSTYQVGFKLTHRCMTYYDLTDDDRVSLTHFNRGTTWVVPLKAPYNEALFKQHVLQFYNLGDLLFQSDIRPPDTSYIARFLLAEINYTHPVIFETSSPYTAAMQLVDGLNAYDGAFHFAVFTVDDYTNGDLFIRGLPEGAPYVGRVQGYYYPAGQAAPLPVSFENNQGDHAIPVLE